MLVMWFCIGGTIGSCVLAAWLAIALKNYFRDRRISKSIKFDVIPTTLEIGCRVEDCPFCPQPHRYIDVIHYEDQYAIHCRLCGALGPSAFNRWEAVGKWNTAVRKKRESDTEIQSLTLNEIRQKHGLEAM